MAESACISKVPSDGAEMKTRHARLVLLVKMTIIIISNGWILVGLVMVGLVHIAAVHVP